MTPRSMAPTRTGDTSESDHTGGMPESACTGGMPESTRTGGAPESTCPGATFESIRTDGAMDFGLADPIESSQESDHTSSNSLRQPGARPAARRIAAIVARSASSSVPGTMPRPICASVALISTPVVRFRSTATGGNNQPQRYPAMKRGSDPSCGGWFAR